jgi:hypothetical protein
MRKLTIALVILTFINVNLLIFGLPHHAPIPQPQTQQQPPQEKPKPQPHISVKTPPFLTYPKVIEQMHQWQSEAPDFVEIGTYGKTSKGTDLCYLRLHRKDLLDQPKVLIMSSIHGNEPLASSVNMAYIGNLLDEYGKSEEITKLIDSRDLYFIPVVSPNSAPQNDDGAGMQRYIEGVDPNRNFPTKNKPNLQSVPTVAAIEDFFNKEHFSAAISGHTWGRLFLKPWGDSNQTCPNDADYQEILGKMAQLSNYAIKPASAIYGKPIIGTEVDWFYRHGAFSIVIEYGTHQHVPSMDDIDVEFKRTYPAVLWFIETAPEVKIKHNTADWQITSF